MKGLNIKALMKSKPNRKKRITAEVARDIKEDLRRGKYAEANIRRLRETLGRLEARYVKEFSFRSLAVKHNCSESTIKDIKYGRSWKDVKI